MTSRWVCPVCYMICDSNATRRFKRRSSIEHVTVNMPPKKPKSKDIRTFFPKSGDPGSSRLSSSQSKQPGGARGSDTGGAESQTGAYNEVKVKKENNGESEDGHSHRFKVIFSRCPRYEYPIDCDRPCTVLQAVKLCEKYNNIIRHSDQQIMLQVGKGQECIVATHFPCSCISDNEFLILSCDKSNVEETQSYYDQTVQPRDNYSVFYIETRGEKKVFRNNAVKRFSFLCVYGEKEMTVEEALKRDGRFVDELGDFHLFDCDNSKRFFGQTKRVKSLHGKKFRIHPQKNKRANNEKQQEKAGTSDSALQVLDVGKQTGISVRKAVEKSCSDVDREEINKILRQQFPRLKEWMEKRFTADSYQEILKLKKESQFGKIQQSFSEVHRLKRMFKLGESVCKVVVKDVCVGTGFVLFDNFILTNGHLFKDYVTDGRLQQDIDVSVLFNYEEPEPDTNYFYFKLADSYIWYGEDDLDYAVLQLNPEVQECNQTTQKKIMKVPPGLLKNFGPLPPNGEACIIGHPAGGVKKVDPICIIEKERREQAVNDHISKYKDSDFIVHLIINSIKSQGIDSIMMGGHRADEVSTYNTFMYHGSSGSPVFDAHGRVFGLHTSGYVYGFPREQESVIEFAQPLLTVFKHFVSKMEERGEVDLLEKVKKEAKNNEHLKKVLELQTADTEELSDSPESMDVD